MKLVAFLATALAVGAVVHARPVVIEEAERIAPPDPSYGSFWSGVGLDGDYAIVLGYRNILDPGGYDDTERTVFLFRRVNGAWTYVRPLSSDLESNEGDGPASVGVDLANNYAVLSLQPLRVFERVGTDYVQRLEGGGDSRTAHVQIEGNRFVFGGGCWGGSVSVRISGTWTGEGYLPGEFCGSTDSATGGPVSISGAWASVSIPWNESWDGEPLPTPAVLIYRRTSTTGSNQWTQWQRVVAEPGHYAMHVALSGTRMFVGDYERYGTAIYERNASNQYTLLPRKLVSGGEWMRGNTVGNPYGHDGSVEASPNYVMRHTFDYDRQANVVQVFQPQGAGYEHVATLVPSDGGLLTGQIAINGRHVLLAGRPAAYYYELPESFVTPAVIQDGFAGTTAPGWSVLPGSDFRLAQSGYSRAFRQLSTAGDAGAVLDAANWANQSIQADVKPTAVNGNDRFVGLATRRTDADHYYYVTLRSSGTIQLKRKVPGSFQTLATAPAPFALNRRYRLRLESIGSLHVVYLDGVKLLEAHDSALKQGRPALLSYRLAADYDNVLVSPSPTLSVYESTREDACIPSCGNTWNYNGGDWTWVPAGNGDVLSQNSITDWSRASGGEPTSNPDMTVEARVRLRAFGATNPWFGIMARVNADATSYTYMALRGSNTVTLHKVNGATVTQLASTNYTVTPGAWYRLRLDTVGDRVRGYINGYQVLEGTDSAPAAGVGGLVTYRTQADFDDYKAVVP
jgi:hypothetical protein